MLSVLCVVLTSIKSMEQDRAIQEHDEHIKRHAKSLSVTGDDVEG